MLAALFVASSLFGLSQTKAKKGDYKFLKGEKTLTLVFDYSNMIVGKQLKEDAYVSKKVKDKNKKEAGSGDKWKESWLSAREEKYEPKFVTLINKSMFKMGMVASKEAKAKYTMTVKTVYTEPGFNVGVMKKPAFVNYLFIFTDNESGKEVGRYLLEKVPGSQAAGFDYDVGTRIAESYAKGGKMIGAYISKSNK